MCPLLVLIPLSGEVRDGQVEDSDSSRGEFFNNFFQQFGEEPVLFNLIVCRENAGTCNPRPGIVLSTLGEIEAVVSGQ